MHTTQINFVDTLWVHLTICLLEGITKTGNITRDWLLKQTIDHWQETAHRLQKVLISP